MLSNLYHSQIVEIQGHSTPDLAPHDFHFSDFKKDLKGTYFTSDEKMKEAVKSLDGLKARPATYFSETE